MIYVRVTPHAPRGTHVYSSSGYSISSGRTLSSNSSGVRKPSATVASFNDVPSLWAFFAHLATSAYARTVSN